MEKQTPNPVPAWINESYFVEILTQSCPQFSTIKNFQVKLALGAGENYASVMLRISIDVELTDKSAKAISYMMKVPHDYPNMQQMLEVMNIFDVENEAYINVLPKFEQLYKEKGVDITFAPRAYKFTESVKKEPKLANTVVMHDLGQDGFKNLNRLEGLNFEQTKFALRKLAQYNAGGAHCYSVNGPYSDTLMRAKANDKGLAMFLMIIQPFQTAFLANLNQYKDGDKYHEKLTKLFPILNKQLPEVSTFDPKEFNVLIHGDCWLNNLLFKMDSKGELEEMRFVDFQMPRFGHPATDVLNFLMTSVNIEHKLKHFDYFIYYYHSQLVEHLRILGYKEPLPTLRDMHIKTYKYRLWTLISCIMALPLVILDPTEAATSDNLMGAGSEGGDQLKNLMFRNKRYVQYMEQILPWLDNRGLLDV